MLWFQRCENRARKKAKLGLVWVFPLEVNVTASWTKVIGTRAAVTVCANLLGREMKHRVWLAKIWKEEEVEEGKRMLA
ncbi:hypothetical protein RRG08_020838 [Elysia crispata]|uniref:Uncharacterized protein n=1 Tax=Elysia crispata TaxID=231223 RepID=A0AAE0XUU9_9GAST|nr:hypothetical protein RRG08_020838 [Elysia crispata]